MHRSEFPRKITQIVARRPSERINGLGGVPHNAHLVDVPQPQAQEAMLQRRDVLVLVDRDAIDAAADAPRLPGESFDDVAHQQQDVIKVHPVGSRFLALIFLSNFREGIRLQSCRRHAPRRLAHGRVILRGDEAHLCPVDLGFHVLHRPFVQVGPVRHDAHGFRQRLRRALVNLGEGVGGHGIPHQVELTQRRRMEGACLHVPEAQAVQPRMHLLCRPFGECDGEHVGGIPHVQRTRIGDATGDRARFAGTSARDDAHGAARGHRRPSLGFVKAFQQGFGIHMLHANHEVPSCKAGSAPNGSTACRHHAATHHAMPSAMPRHRHGGHR